MNRTIMVTYKILCNADVDKVISIQDILSNEKIAKVIKSEYAKGIRNVVLLSDTQDINQYR